MRIGHGYDVHRLVSGRPCIIGGVNIPFELGLDGHSDADVLTHAVMDSLLGALALGADAVMICRPFLISYYGGGMEGIVTYVEKLRAELTDAMYMCGARSLGDITRDMVREVR